MSKFLKTILVIIGSIVLTSYVFYLVTTIYIPRESVNYYEFMTELSEPTRLNTRFSDANPNVWATHYFIINEQETLYYGPRRIEHDGNIYINAYEFYIVRKESDALFTPDTYTRINESTLRLIFESYLE